MNPTLKHNLDKLGIQKKLILEEVAALSTTDFHRAPAAGKWSISQILTHLLTAERMSVAYLKKKSLGIKQLENTGIMENVKFLILKISQRIPSRYKAPRVVLENTPPALSYEEIVVQWEALNTEISGFLETIAEDDIHKKIYKHPYMGMLNVNHGVQFLREHIIHHQRQVRRILRLIKKEMR